MGALSIARSSTIEADCILNSLAQVRVTGDVLVQSPKVVVGQLNIVARCGCRALQRRDPVAFEGAVCVAPMHV